MTEYDEHYDISLFDDDLSEFQASDEGKVIKSLLTYNDNDCRIRKSNISSKQLRNAFDTYWENRNTDVDIDETNRTNLLHYSDQKAREEGIKSDNWYAEAYREQN